MTILTDPVNNLFDHIYIFLFYFYNRINNDTNVCSSNNVAIGAKIKIVGLKFELKLPFYDFIHLKEENNFLAFNFLAIHQNLCYAIFDYAF